MKTIAIASPNIESSGMTVTEMGVSKKNIQKMLGYVRNNIYSDKILAVIREYTTNAVDEHNKYKIEKPVLIGMRNLDGADEFFVRDFANGLSDNDVRNVFAMSGESTKDQSNDDIGGFGIGAKCGLSYSNSFFVYSHFNGVKTTYSFSLGANEFGETVGQVYDLDKSPTNESGLEIIVPIESRDSSSFNNKIRDFVSISPYNIESNIFGEKLKPNPNSLVKKIKDYTFRMVECNGLYEGSLFLQMGGITYKNFNKFSNKEAKIKKGFCLIADIPIGKCSIALNRESFEVSDRNEKVFNEIIEIINELSVDDLKQFRNKTVLDLVNDSLSEMKVYEGEIFSSYIKDLYSDVWKFVQNISKHDSIQPLEQKNGKPICAVIPENDYRGYWRSKIQNYLRNSNLNIYIVSNPSSFGKTPEGLAAINDCFKLICARKLPYPKVPKTSGQFTIYQRNNSIGRFTTIEFFNYLSEKKKWGFEAKTEKEVSDYLSAKIHTIDSIEELEPIAIKYSGRRDTYSYVISSTAFFEKLKQLGFVIVGGAIWQKVHNEAKEKQRKKQETETILGKAKKSWLSYGPKTENAITKIRHAEKINKFWENIINEGSLRSKILSKLSDNQGYYITKVKISRDELRKILALK